MSSARTRPLTIHSTDGAACAPGPDVNTPPPSSPVAFAMADVTITAGGEDTATGKDLRTGTPARGMGARFELTGARVVAELTGGEAADLLLVIARSTVYGVTITITGLGGDDKISTSHTANTKAAIRVYGGPGNDKIKQVGTGVNAIVPAPVPRTVRVVDRATGAALPNVEVELNGVVFVTNAAGEFQTTYPIDLYEVRLDVPG